MSHREQALEFVRRFAAGDVNGPLLQPRKAQILSAPSASISLRSDSSLGALTPVRLQPDLPKAADTGQPIRMIHPTMCGVELPCHRRAYCLY